MQNWRLLIIQVNVKGNIAFIGYTYFKHYRPGHDAKYAEYIFKSKIV